MHAHHAVPSKRGEAPPPAPHNYPSYGMASRHPIEESEYSMRESRRESVTLASPLRACIDHSGGREGVSLSPRAAGMQKRMVTAPSHVLDPLQWYIDHAEAAESSGQFAESERYLQAAFEQLHRSEYMPLEMTCNVSTQDDAKLEQDRLRTADILRRFGKLFIRKREYKQALSLLMFSSRIDPLTPVTYVLRGACHEHLGHHASAYEDYKNYFSLCPPTMALMAHTGQCALKAGHYEEAEKYLYELLEMTKKASSTFSSVAPSSVAPPGNFLALFDSPSFYEAHAYYCLGLVKENQAAEAASASPTTSVGKKADELTRSALDFYKLAVSNSAYMAALEDAAESAIAVKDAPLALENLRHLQRLRVDCAHYYSRAADVCAMINDTDAEVEELSKALDQYQPIPDRQKTLLRRAAVYASKLQDLDKAIVDLSLLLSLPGDDHCTAMAYLQRAKAFEQRSCENLRSSREDVAAALRDYNSFVVTALMHPQELPAPPKCITDAMLILANGAFTEKCYSRAARFFARAVARGWQPHEVLPQKRQEPKTAMVTSSISLLGVDLLTKMYVAIAHTIVEQAPVAEDMFRVPYESREKTLAPLATDLKKMKAAERKEAEKPMVPVPAVSYQVVEEHYQRLRVLGPTVFSSLQYELLELWEPYRTEVERLREDLMLTRSGKKIKRR